MNLFGYNLHFKKEAQPQSLPQGDTAWSEDSMLNMGQWPKYNPDLLIRQKGSGVYRKMMLDEQVKAAVRFKRDAISSREYTWEVDRDELGDEEADRRIAIAQLTIDKCKGSFTDKLNGILSSIYQGFSLTEKLFMTIEYDGLTYWGIKDLKLKPYDTFEFKVDQFGNVEELLQKVAGKDIRLNMSKFIHFVNNPDYDEHYGGSELREAYRAWFSKEMAIRFWNMWLERHAGGYRSITSEGDAVLTPGSAMYTSLQNVLRNTVGGSGVILPKNTKMELVFPSNNVAYKEAIDHHDLGIARSLLVPNLLGITPTGQTGSYSQSETQLSAFFMTLNADSNRLEEILNEDLFRHLGELNFGDDYWPKFKFNKYTIEQAISIASAWKDMVQGGSAQRSDTDEAYLRNLLGIPEKDEESVVQPVKPTVEPTDDKGGDPNLQNDKTLPDETLMGKALRAYSIDSASQRVDFTVIAKTTDDLATENINQVSRTMDQLVADAILQMRVLGDRLDSSSSKTIKFDKSVLRTLNKQISSSLSEYWQLGKKHAQSEIDKAKGAVFSSSISGEQQNFVSEKFIKDKAFKVAGNLSTEAISIIQGIILNGVKGGKSLATMEKEIYATFAAKGMISQERAKEALGQALGSDAVANARIATMMRTNGFEAVNEARFNYFSDPALDDFVQALEYSAILDSRTTQICQNLDNHVHAINSEVWQSFRPPNHYNCRSLLIPITDIDQWTESDEPVIDPQQGFK